MTHIHQLPPELKAMILSQLSTREIIQNARGIDSQFRALVDEPGNNVLLYKPISDRERRRLRKGVSEVTAFPEGMNLLHAFRRFLARRGRWTSAECQEWTNLILAKRWTQDRVLPRRDQWSPDARRWLLRWIVLLLRVLFSLYSQVHRHEPHLWPDIPHFTDSAHFKQLLQAWDHLPPRWLLECVQTTDINNNGTPQATLQPLTQWFVQITHERLKWLEGRGAPSNRLCPPNFGAVSSVSWISHAAYRQVTAGQALRPNFRRRPPAEALQRTLGVPEISGFGPSENQVETCYCVRPTQVYWRLDRALHGQAEPLRRQHESWILEHMYVL